MPLLRFFFRNWAALKTDILRPSQPADISFNSLWVERGNEKSLLCQLFLLLLTKYISRYDIGGLSTFQIDIHIFWDILKLDIVSVKFMKMNSCCCCYCIEKKTPFLITFVVQKCIEKANKKFSLKWPDYLI